MTSVATRIASAIAGAALLGCTSDHGLLAQRPEPQEDGSITDGAANDTFPVNPRDVTMSFDARDPEPPGPWALTLVNGVVDVGSVRFCFVPFVDGGEEPTDDAPIPAAPGLAFGAHVVVTGLAGADLRSTDLHPYLVIGADGASASSCKQIVRGQAVDAAFEAAPDGSEAGSTAPVAVSLPLVPAGTLAESRSYLAVASGCALPAPTPAPSDAAIAGDAGDASDASDAGDDRAARLAVCGPDLGPTSIGLSLVRMSRRLDFSKVGFQAVNGSNAAAPASFIIENRTTNLTLFFGDSLALGGISPHAQPGYVSPDDFGQPIGGAALHVEPPTGTAFFPEFQTTLGNVLTSSHVDSADLVGASLFTFVLLGARPGQDAAPTGHPFRIELVPSAPTVARD